MSKLENMIGLRFVLLLQGLSLPSAKREEGQTLAEYALILSGIAVLVATAAYFLGGKIQGMFSSIGSQI